MTDPDRGFTAAELLDGKTYPAARHFRESAWCSDARGAGEGPGNGTGMPVWSNKLTWRLGTGGKIQT